MPKFHVQRSIEIEATPNRVYEVVADFGTWTAWSPWLCAEPDAEVVVRGEAATVGASYCWKGEVVGQGEIEHQRLEPGQLIEDEIRFLKPMRSTSKVAFDIVPQGDLTRLTWHMQGSMPWFMFWMVPMLEGYIGMDYDRGLKMLKEWIETGEIQSKTVVRDVQPVGPLRMAGVRRRCQLAEIGSSMEEAFTEAERQFGIHGLPVGQPISVYHDFKLKTQTFDYSSGFVLEDTEARVPDELSQWQIPAVRALQVDHLGSYSHLGNAWSAAQQVARYRKLRLSRGGAFELYLNDPQETPPAQLETRVFLPLK